MAVVDYLTPKIGNSSSTTTFVAGFTKLSIIGIAGITTVAIIEENGTPSSTNLVNLPIGLPIDFEGPNGRPHAGVVVTTTGTFLYQEYR